jgi:hypothetical protein
MERMPHTHHGTLKPTKGSLLIVREQGTLKVRLA